MTALLACLLVACGSTGMRSPATLAPVLPTPRAPTRAPSAGAITVQAEPSPLHVCHADDGRARNPLVRVDDEASARPAVYALRAAVASSRPRLRAERWSEGEDASSGYHYLRLSEAGETRMVRVVWNGGAQDLATVMDLFFERGGLAGGWERIVAREEVAAVARGDEPRGSRLDAMWRFEGGRLRSWLLGGSGSVTEPRVAPCDRWLHEEQRLLAFATAAPPGR